MVKLGQPEPVGAVNDDRVRARDIEPAFDDRGREQHFVALFIERAHPFLDFTRRHLAVCSDRADFGHRIAQPFFDRFHVRDARHHDEALPAAMMLAQQSLAHDHLVPLHHVSPHREPVDRRGLDRGQLAQARHRHLQGPRDRRGGEGQHVDVGPQRLERFLVRHAKALLFVHDYQPKLPEAQAFCEQGVRPDHDVDRAIGKARLGRLGFLVADQPRQPPDLEREPGKAFDKTGIVLACKERGGGNYRDLVPRHRRNERGAQRNLGLAEANIAADQPVHRFAGGQIGQHVVNRGVLIVGLLPRKALNELVVAGLFGREHRGLAQRALGRGLEQFVRNRADAFL